MGRCSLFGCSMVGAGAHLLLGALGIVAAASAPALGQVAEAWTARFDSGSRDTAVGLAVDGDGNVYVAGNARSARRSSGRFTVIKYDADGRELWVSDTILGRPSALLVDPAGGVLVSGENCTLFDDDSIEPGCLVSESVTVKLDSGGEHVWTLPRGGPLVSLAVDAAGHAFVSGAGTVKVSAAGEPLWSIPADGDIAVDASGNLFISRELTVKYDTAGNLLWTVGQAGALAVDADGNCYVTGFGTTKYSASGNELWSVPRDGIDLAMDGLGRVLILSSARREVAAYDSEGVELWVAPFGATVSATPRAFAVGVDGGVVVGGTLRTDAGFASDFLTVEYGPDGAPRWQARWGSSAPEELEAVAVGAAGATYVVGTADGMIVTIKYEPTSDGVFRRGDANADGSTTLTDAIFLLEFLFLGGGPPDCQDSADSNDDAELTAGDAIFLLNHLFLGGAPPAAPFPGCGGDLTADELPCVFYGSCP